MLGRHLVPSDDFEAVKKDASEWLSTALDGGNDDWKLKHPLECTL